LRYITYHCRSAAYCLLAAADCAFTESNRIAAAISLAIARAVSIAIANAAAEPASMGRGDFVSRVAV
jgi:hypothetical protein